MKLEIEIENLDFDALAEKLLSLTDRPDVAELLQNSGNPVAMLLSGGLSGKLAKKIVLGLSAEQKETLAVDLLNASAGKLQAAVEKEAGMHGVKLC